MKQWEKQYNKITKFRGVFSPDKASFYRGFREALLWFRKTAEHLSPSDYDLIDEELEDD